MAKVYGTTIENFEIIDAAAEGVCFGKLDGKVVFVPFTVPGDVVDVMLVRSKKNYAEGFVRKICKSGTNRIDAICEHFTLCGGCKWQHLDYNAQLELKKKQIIDNFERIGNIAIKDSKPICQSENIFYYRNKLEFAYTNMRWLTNEELNNSSEYRGLGFHLPSRFDKVFNVHKCYLQSDYSNEIRNIALQIAIEQDLSFYDRRKHEGFLRNLMVRNSSSGEWLVTVVFGFDHNDLIFKYLTALKERLPKVSSWIYIVNTKANDSMNDLNFNLFSGADFFVEVMEHLKFNVGPLSFYQVNVPQALSMYRAVRELCDFRGNEVVYDLYTGTGTIALFVAPNAKSVVGIENVPQAIDDANINAKQNNIDNVEFVCGDLAKTLTDDFVIQRGMPNIIISDPPRSGMHPDVVAQIMKIEPEKVVYVSCNPATQARDISLMQDKYYVAEIRPFDMFPHTHHVENIALLKRI